MALAPVGIQVRALDAAQAKADIAGVKTETQHLVAENRDLAASNQQVKRTTDQATQSHRQDKQAVDALTQAVQRQNSAQSAGLVPMQRGAAAMQNFGHVANQLSFQVQDFFVQMASGQSLMMAFAQQAPQAAGAFSMLGGRIGTVIPYIGTFIAIGAAVAPMLFNMGRGAKSASDAFSDAETALGNYTDAIDAANMSHEELIAKYGRLSGAARGALTAMADVARLDAIAAVRDQVDAVASGIQDTFSMIGVRSGAYVRDLLSDLGLTADQMVQVINLSEQLQTATTLEDQGQIASEFRQQLLGIYGTAEAMPDAVLGWYRELSRTVHVAGATATEIVRAGDAAETLAAIDMASGIQSAAAMALNMADALGRAVISAQGLSGLSLRPIEEFGITPGQGSSNLPGMGFFGTPAANSSLAPETSVNPPNRTMEQQERWLYGDLPTTGGAGGGRNLIDMEAERQRRAAEGYFTRTRTPQEEYASTVTELEALKSGGFLDGDTFTRAMQDAREQMDGVAKDTLGVGSAFSNLLSGMMDGAQTAGDAMEGFVASVLNNVLAKIMQPSVDVLGNAASSFISGFMPKGPTLSFDGGGWTGSGSRSGGLDGKGGYMAMIHPREYIHDTTKGAMPQQGGQQNVQIVPSKYFDVVVDERSDRVAVNRSAQTYRQTQRTMPGHIANMQGRGLA